MTFKTKISFFSCKKLRVLSVGLFLVFALSINAQNIKADLAKMNSLTRSTDQFHAKLTVKVFNSEKSTNPSVTQQYEIKKSGQDFFYKIDQKRILINSRCFLVIDDKNKTISYSKNGKKPQLPTQNMEVNIDSLVDAYDAVKYKGKKDGLKHYIIYKKGGAIPTVEIYFSSGGDKIRKLIYHYDKEKFPTNNLVEINYTKWTFSPIFSKNEFSEKKYIKKSNNKIQLVAALKGYKLTVNGF